MLSPSTAVYILFLKSCTLTNKAMGAIWQDLSPNLPIREKALFLVLINYFYRLRCFCTDFHYLSTLVGSVNRFDNTMWMALVTPSDRPKLVEMRTGERFLKEYIDAIFHQILTSSSPRYFTKFWHKLTWRTFKCFFEACDIFNRLLIVLKWRAES